MSSQKEKNTKILNLTNHKLIEQTFLLAYIRQLKNGQLEMHIEHNVCCSIESSCRMNALHHDRWPSIHLKLTGFSLLKSTLVNNQHINQFLRVQPQRVVQSCHWRIPSSTLDICIIKLKLLVGYASSMYRTFPNAKQYFQ